MKVFGRSKWSTGLCSSCQVANDVMGSIRTVGSFFAKQWNFTRTMGRYASLEYGHYGNPTTEFRGEKDKVAPSGWSEGECKGALSHFAYVMCHCGKQYFSAININIVETKKSTPQEIGHCKRLCSKVVDGSQILSLSKDCWGWIQSRVSRGATFSYLKLGYNHEVELSVPPNVSVFCFKPNIVCLPLGQINEGAPVFASLFHSCKPPEVYKGKGIMYVDEVIKKKQGKKSK
ncbi:hypothetical protein IFM89_004903 [Coptis chinensis]|uniref:Ribosomal protein L6 n=1 Tax=Coptis chinensis TaxID=261450 RepID=A0A835I1K8_9MAGN|nr:hypothetical protein IFM89_004903 [Coptis chinensis]